MEEARMSRLGRRDLLKLGALAAGAAACRGGIIRTAPIFRAGPDYAAEAAKAYQESLKALRRTGVNPAGTEVAESGSGRLSLGPDELRTHRKSRPGQPDFDVLIIGSGYGGAVCAARLAAHRKPGVKIAVLERGREWVPGTFPFSLANFSPFSRQSSWLRQRLSRNPLGLYGFHNQGDLTVVTGSGLGGSSLINCAVVIETAEAVFRQPSWPEELSSKERLRPYYDRAQRVLAPQRTPEDRFSPKLKTHLGTAAALVRKGVWQADAYAVPLAITFSDRTNAQGIRQHGCVECGDCSTGCNVGAKHTLDMNYLPLAWSRGALMFTQTEVDRVEKATDHYRVHCTLRSGRFFSEDHDVVTARMVILAAGTLGTNEILLRSRQTGGLAVSDWLGKSFSANGNHLWFVDYQHADAAVATNSAGVGVVLGTPRAPVGPSIQGVIDFRRGDRPLVGHVVFEDLAHPSALADGVGALTVADLNRAITLLACGHDTADGEIRLENNEASVHWPGYGSQACRAEMAALVAQYATAYGGYAAPFTPGDNTTAHPLGGCRMAATAADGVVNHRGEVFDPTRGRDGRAVQPGLYVADASIIPSALGNNPLLTITALAERVADLMLRDPRNATLFQAPAAGPSGPGPAR
jgi:cholesterol oxidase